MKNKKVFSQRRELTNGCTIPDIFSVHENKPLGKFECVNDKADLFKD
jgi:hypothetical protein